MVCAIRRIQRDSADHEEHQKRDDGTNGFQLQISERGYRSLNLPVQAKYDDREEYYSRRIGDLFFLSIKSGH